MGVVVSDRIGHAPVHRVVEEGRSQEVEGRLGLRLVDVLALARAFPVLEGGQDAGRVVADGDEVGVGAVGPGGGAARPAGQRLEAGDTGGEVSEARQVAPRTGLPQQAARDHHEVGLQPAQRLPAEAVALDHARCERLGDHVRPSREVESDLATLVAREIEGDAQLVGVRALETAGPLHVRMVELVGRNHPQRVRSRGRLDVHDLGPVVGEHPGRARAREHPEEVEDLHSLEGETLRRGCRRPGDDGSARGLGADLLAVLVEAGRRSVVTDRRALEAGEGPGEAHGLVACRAVRFA